MNFKDYQDTVNGLAIYPGKDDRRVPERSAVTDPFVRQMLKAFVRLGTAAEQTGKVLRDDEGQFTPERLNGVCRQMQQSVEAITHLLLRAPMNSRVQDTGIAYVMLKLVGEVAELCGKLLDDYSNADCALEAGDSLWYLTRMAEHLGFSLGSLAELNVRKLTSRKRRGQIQGDGDNR